MTNLAPKLTSIVETFSVPELQQRTITRMTGAEIAAHNAIGEPLNIFCIEDGSGYIKGHYYGITDDGIIYDIFAPHNHTSTATGGSLYEIKRDNYKNLIELDYSANIFPEIFWKSVVGTGTLLGNVDSTSKFVQFTTTAANNDAVNGELGGGRLFFGKPLTLQIKYAVSHNVSVNYRLGPGTPKIENNVGVGAQLGFEGCTGTNQLNRVHSGSGSAWSAEDMLNMVQANPLGLRIDYYPSSKIVATDGLGTVITKTTDLPAISTATNSISLCRVGIKTLTTAARNFKIYAMRIVGYSYDNESGIGGWL